MYWALYLHDSGYSLPVKLTAPFQQNENYADITFQNKGRDPKKKNYAYKPDDLASQ
jgi:hypothetical protein